MTDESKIQLVNPQVLDAIEDDRKKGEALLRVSQNTADKELSYRMYQLANRIHMDQDDFEPDDEPIHQTAASSWNVCTEALKCESLLYEFVNWKEDVHIFELEFPHWEFSPEDLEKVDLRQLNRELTTWFNPATADGKEGWALGFFQGGFDPVDRTFLLTVKGICNSRMVQPIEVLGGLGNKAIGDEQSYARVIPRAQYNEPLASLVQTRWLLRLQINADAGPICLDDCAPIPDRYLAESLLWLDRWSFTDLRFSVGLQIDEQLICEIDTSALHTPTRGRGVMRSAQPISPTAVL